MLYCLVSREEDPTLVASEERGRPGRIFFPLSRILFLFLCTISTGRWFGKAALLQPFIEF